jgi:hypothetical protein
MKSACARTYILRVYRATPRELVGVVEIPGSGWQQAFQDIAHLEKILLGPPAAPARTPRARSSDEPQSENE